MSSARNTIGTLGLRHLALNVADVGRSQAFYEAVFGMKVVWQPDPDNVYLTSGADNLALHKSASGPVDGDTHQRLDHFGFLMPSVDAVTAMYRHVAAAGAQYGAKIAKEPKRHRDGSYSFYLHDPDGALIQVLYEPNISGPAT
jgi:catechol 2,3-dioxygenase-like lactoylglutathione lyase family enzyme